MSRRQRGPTVGYSVYCRAVDVLVGHLFGRDDLEVAGGDVLVDRLEGHLALIVLLLSTADERLVLQVVIAQLL